MDYKSFIQKLGFLPKENAQGIFYKKYSNCLDYNIEVDFDNNKFNFGNLITADSKTTQNFSQDENWVVLECVNRFLEKGYQPQNIVLEKTWATGHGTSGRLDILINHNNGSAYLMIECKTYGTEFDKEFKRILKDGGQLFTYFQQDKNADILMLYASELDKKGNIQYINEIIKIEDDYRQTGNVKDFYDRWNKLPKNNGVFDDWVKPYDFQSKALTPKSLKEIKQEDSSFIFNRFLEILRHNVVSDKPNAFNKIFTLFLCKIYDEKSTRNTQELSFQWIEGIDNNISFQKRLADLYKKGMKEFLEKEVSDLSDKEFEDKFGQYINDEATKQKILDQFTEIRLKKNNEFAIKEVFDDVSFEDNAKVVKEVVELLQGYKIRYTKRHQYLSDFFELLLTTGLKQESGQFFTPVPIAQFIIKSIPLDKIVLEKLNSGEADNLLPAIIDYAAGSGHFLTESMHEIQRILNKETADNYIDKTAIQIKKWQLDHFDWAINYVYGIEKDYRLVKVGKVGCYLHGDGLAKVIHGDGLANFTEAKEYQGKLKHRDRYFPQENKQFDILLSNPPYSVSAFKGTLKNVENDFDLYNDLTDQSSQIECLFIERTKQLLKDGGIAGIILPSSILSNGGIYTKAREIILQYFDIVAIAELGSNTFMATGTNTVTLFLRRRKNEVSQNTRLLADKFAVNLQDVTINSIEKPVSKYVSHVWGSITYNDYITLLQKQPNETVQNHELYKEYQKKIIAKTEGDKWNIILEKEQEKLYYFILTYLQKVVLIKSGEKNEEKQFLGYEFSNRRGSEGIHPMQRGKSIDECTAMFDPEVFDNPEKASTYIYKAFQNDYEFQIPFDLQKNISQNNLVDMLSFDRSDFEKNISLTVKKKVFIKNKWELMRLGDICETGSGGTPLSGTPEYYDEGNILWINSGEVRQGLITSSENKIAQLGLKNSSAKIFPINTVLIAMYGATAGQVGILGVEASTNQAVCGILPNKNILPLFLFNYLRTQYENLLELRSGVARLNISQDIVKNLKVPLPPIEIQEKIVTEIELLEDREGVLKTGLVNAISNISNITNTLFIDRNEKIRLNDFFVLNKLSIDPKIHFNHNSFIYVDIDSVEKGTGKIFYQQRILGSNAPSRARRKAENNSVIISTVRPYLKGFAYISSIPDDVIFSTGFAIIKSIDENRYLSKLLFYYFMYSSDLMRQIEKKMPKAAYPSINKEDIDSFQLPNIDIKEQQKILVQIEAIEKEIAELEKDIAEIPKLKEAILKKHLN